MDDEKIYNAILDELHATGPRQGLWAKCFTEANGNENAAKALYFKYRALQIVSEKNATKTVSSSTELKELLPSKKIISQPITSNLKTYIFFIIVGIIIFAFSLYAKEQNRKTEENKKAAELVLLVKRQEEEKLREFEEKNKLKNSLRQLPDFDLHDFRKVCNLIGNVSFTDEYKSSIIKMQTLSQERISELKNKFNSASIDKDFLQTVDNIFRLHDKVLDSWCNTFVGATWSQSSGSEAGLANCRTQVNKLHGYALTSVASNFIDSNSIQSNFSKVHGLSDLQNICSDKTCLDKIYADISHYASKIKTYLSSIESRKKYTESTPPGRLLWIQSLEKTNEYNRALADLICNNLLATQKIEVPSQKITECKISLNLYWLNNFSNAYEIFKQR